MENTVFAVGPRNADIMIVGEAPGQEEARQRIPFVGGSGKILNYILRDAGIDRAKCRISNVVNIRPPRNNFDTFYKDSMRRVPTDELIAQRNRLYTEINQTKPNVIIALGGEALKALTGKPYITKWRGSIIDSPYGKVVPTLHPAMIMRQWSSRPIAVFDLQRAYEESKTPIMPVIKTDFILNPSADEALEEMHKMESSEYLSFDIETTRGWPKYITCIGFADSEERAICVPLVGGTGVGHYWKDSGTESEIWRGISRLLNSPSRKIAQNAQFDISILSYNGVYVNNLWFDTMIGHHTLHPELPKGLDFLCSVYTKHPFYKDTSHSDLWNYNCLDCVVTYESAFKILEELRDFKTDNFYFHNAHPLIEPLIDVQHRGVKIDLANRKELSDSLRKRIETNQKLLDEAVGHPLNVNSPKQMKHFLYEELCLDKRFNRKTGQLTANEDALIYLAKRFPSKFFKLVLAIRGDIKLASTWIDAKLSPDDRLRTSYLISGTKSGRLSSREYLDETGINLQNVPKGPARRLVIVDKGNMFTEGDLKQAEARVVAYLANEQAQIDAFESGDDPFRHFAAAIYRKDISDVTLEERNLAKRVSHACNYGIGPGGFAAVMGITMAEAKVAIKGYFNTFVNIGAWHVTIEGQLRRTRILETPFGRKRMFFGRIDHNTLREAYSYIPQAVVADIVDLALTNLHWTLPKGARVALQIHDALVVEHKESQRVDVTKIMKTAMEQQIVINGKNLTIPAEFSHGHSWDELN